MPKDGFILATYIDTAALIHYLRENAAMGYTDYWYYTGGHNHLERRVNRCWKAKAYHEFMKIPFQTWLSVTVIRARNDNYDMSNTWGERKRGNRGKRKQRKKRTKKLRGRGEIKGELQIVENIFGKSVLICTNISEYENCVKSTVIEWTVSYDPRCASCDLIEPLNSIRLSIHEDISRQKNSTGQIPVLFHATSLVWALICTLLHVGFLDVADLSSISSIHQLRICFGSIAKTVRLYFLKSLPVASVTSQSRSSGEIFSCRNSPLLNLIPLRNISS
jgi:hypothetical protein